MAIEPNKKTGYVENIYGLSSFILSFGIPTLILHFIDIHYGWKIPIIIIVGFIILWILASIEEELLDSILPKKYKDEIGFYIIRWKSKEFDYFAGEDLIKKEMKEFLEWYFGEENLQLLKVYTTKSAYQAGQKVDQAKKLNDSEASAFDSGFIATMMYNWAQDKTFYNWVATQGKYK